MQLIECVVNFSEGKDRTLIHSIEDTLKPFKKVYHLHTDIGEDANRTVITFAGQPDEVCNAAFAAIARATLLIDMTKQKGEHPRIGATDVVPLVPLQGISLEETTILAGNLARQIGEELQIPVYLYSENATTPQRKSLPFIRKGNYESLTQRMNEGFLPDYGPHSPHPTAGATAVGARNLMLAYNINLKSQNVPVADQIAKKLRSTGYLTPATATTPAQRIPGKFTSLQAKGWHMKEYHCAQVTTNIHDPKATPLHLLYESVKEEAKKLGETVNGSQLIGLTPLAPLVEAGKSYFTAQFPNAPLLPEKELVELAIKELGLNSVTPFNPDLQIIERLLRIQLDN